MRCEQFEQRMQGLLDRRAIPERDSVLLSHASRCLRCRTLLHCESEVADFLGHDEEPLPNGLTRSVMADLGLASVRRRRRVWYTGRRWQLAAAAAAVSLCILPALFPRSPRSQSVPSVARQTESPMVPAAVDSTVSPSPVGDGQATRQLVTLASSRWERADEVATTVAGDLSPWARSIGAAFAALTGGWPARHHETSPQGSLRERD